jgi:hypothetical protein
MLTEDLDVCLSGGHVVAVVRGELDVTNTADTVSALAVLAARYQFVVVELSALEFMDCGAERIAESAEAGEAERRRCAAGGARGLCAPAAEPDEHG